MVKKIIIALILICLKTSVFATNNNSFVIESFEGIKKTINVSYATGSGRLAVSCAKDKIYLDWYRATRKIEVLQNKFLMITYSDGGGTGIESVKTAIITISKDKLMVCAYFSSTYNVNVPSTKSQSSVQVKLVLSNKKYLLVTNSSQSGDIVEKGTSISKLDTLSFDTKHKVFYTSYVSKSKTLNVYGPKTDLKQKRFISGKFPMINLINSKFIFINSQWYDEDEMGNLYKSTYR